MTADQRIDRTVNISQGHPVDMIQDKYCPNLGSAPCFRCDAEISAGTQRRQFKKRNPKPHLPGLPGRKEGIFYPCELFLIHTAAIIFNHHIKPVRLRINFHRDFNK